jgi:hypothetical protein
VRSVVVLVAVVVVVVKIIPNLRVSVEKQFETLFCRSLLFRGNPILLVIVNVNINITVLHKTVRTLMGFRCM